MILQSNLLSSALRLIGSSTVLYFKYNARVLNDVGEYVSSYDEPFEIVGSFQPVKRSLYEQYGLDYQKEYFNFYVLNDLVDVSRGVSGDQIEFNGSRFQCESKQGWFPFDQWMFITCVKIDNA